LKKDFNTKPEFLVSVTVQAACHGPGKDSGFFFSNSGIRCGLEDAERVDRCGRVRKRKGRTRGNGSGLKSKPSNRKDSMMVKPNLSQKTAECKSSDIEKLKSDIDAIKKDRKAIYEEIADRLDMLGNFIFLQWLSDMADKGTPPSWQQKKQVAEMLSIELPDCFEILDVAPSGTGKAGA